MSEKQPSSNPSPKAEEWTGAKATKFDKYATTTRLPFPNHARAEAQHFAHMAWNAS
jgi:hypothetical protein